MLIKSGLESIYVVEDRYLQNKIQQEFTKRKNQK